MHTEEYLQSITRKELQVLAKEYNLKANNSSEKLIRSILDLQEDTVDETSVNIPEVQEVQEVKAVQVNKVLEKGDTAYAFINNAWVEVTIKRVNKKTFRIATLDDEESTVDIESVQSQKPVVDDNAMELDIPDEESNDMVSRYKSIPLNISYSYILYLISYILIGS